MSAISQSSSVASAGVATDCALQLLAKVASDLDDIAPIAAGVGTAGVFSKADFA